MVGWGRISKCTICKADVFVFNQKKKTKTNKNSAGKFARVLQLLQPHTYAMSIFIQVAQSICSKAVYKKLEYYSFNIVLARLTLQKPNLHEKT